MKTLKNFILAFATWAMMSVSALATDIIVVSHGQANDPFWSGQLQKMVLMQHVKTWEYHVNTLHQEHLTWWRWQN